uniref:Uncharacterized protein n=1 Tax=Labrus bergylta TaxID=56723 RepID=A0A3Q3GHF8_9LABR
MANLTVIGKPRSATCVFSVSVCILPHSCLYFCPCLCQPFSVFSMSFTCVPVLSFVCLLPYILFIFLFCFSASESHANISPFQREMLTSQSSCRTTLQWRKTRWFSSASSAKTSMSCGTTMRPRSSPLRWWPLRLRANVELSSSRKLATKTKDSTYVTVELTKHQQRSTLKVKTQILCLLFGIHLHPGNFHLPDEPAHHVLHLLTSNYTAVEKDEVILPCDAEVQWFRDGQEIRKTKKYEMIVDGHKRALLIHDCTLDDSKTYTCDAKAFKTSCFLNVEREYSREIQQHEIRQVTDGPFKRVKEPFLICEVSKPSADVTWYKGDQELPEGGRYEHIVDGKKRILLIQDLKMYTAMAGDNKSTAELIISEAPTDFSMNLKDQTIPEFEDAEFTCKLTKEKADVKWYRNGREIREGPRFMMSEGKIHRLQVCEIRPRDQGEYRIIAKDKDAKAKLELAGKTTTACRSTVVKNCTQKIQYRLKDPLKADEGRYKRVQLPLILLISYCFISLDVPGPVKNLQVIDTADGEVSLAWEEPESDGGSKVIGYVMERRDVKRKTWTLATDQADSPDAIINDVIENKEYIFRVKAQNKAGVGKPSLYLFFCVCLPAEPPSPPLNLVWQDQNKNSVQLTWETPLKNGGSMITGYIIERCEDGTDKWLRCNTRLCPDLFYKVSGLRYGTKYNYRVFAENAAGLSGPSNTLGPLLPLTIRVPITGYPTPNAKWTFGEKEMTTADERVTLTTKATFVEMIVQPSVRPDRGTYTLTLENDITSDFKVLEVTRGIFLTWEPPKYDGGTGIRGYNVERCQRGTDKWEPCGDMVPELKCQVTGLIEGQWYSYRVRALNRLGASRPCKATDEIQFLSQLSVTPKAPEIQLDAKLLAGLTAKAGSKIELPAEVKGKPEPRVKWTKADLVLKPDDRVSIDTKPGSSTVTIAKTKRDDSSTYIIEATNSCGRATATVDVNILGQNREMFF